jgi:23S rRNA (cytosine1962-C5)-methyltransferase
MGLDIPDELKAVRVRSLGWSPFVYRKRMVSADDGIEPGELVRIDDEAGRPIGFGFFNPLAELALRVLTRGPKPPGPEWWQTKLTKSLALRRDLLRLDDVTDACRLIHAEGDGLSGLVVDRFRDVLSIESFGIGMDRRAQALAELLLPMTGAAHWRAEPSPRMADLERCVGVVRASTGCPASVDIREFGTRFRVRFEEGHKTGFFCDQRDNRRRLASYCTGRRVLDVCCYTGGFAVQAKRLGQAEEVTAVDLDERAVALAKENANLNQLRIQVVHADAFAYMRDMLRGGKRYDVVVLDPPKLVGDRMELDEGKAKLFDLNRLAMALVEPGGMLLSCCCAGLVSDDEFNQLILSAARRTVSDPADEPTEGRRVQILDRSGASADHPVADNCPESAYLKAVWLRVL